MTQLILKNDIQPLQLNVLIHLLQSWNIEVETLPSATHVKVQEPGASDINDPLSEIRGMCKDYDINARDLRRGILPDKVLSTNVAKQSPTQHSRAYSIEETVSAVVGEPSMPYSSTTKTQKEDI